MNIGDKAPEILGINEKGEEIRLSDYKGKKIVLYFYPKDSTSGCTAQACNLRDNYTDLRKAGYEVIGVSVDNEKSHQKFIEKNNLPFTLIADRPALSNPSCNGRGANRSRALTISLIFIISRKFGCKDMKK